MIEEIPWWKQTTVYQIYPRSFKDSTGNGIGDLKGIISKLDYIKDLGINTIWISPFFSSPQQDMGYDISNYQEIAEEYGNMKTCDELITEIHKRDMKIVLDMVLNHTSDKHPWFIESRSSKDNPKRDWYIWKEGQKPGGKTPPNNWNSMTGGRGWHYDKKTDEWYYAAFLKFQPDLNYRNHEVKNAMFNVLRFWLDKGVDGFRLDIIGSIYEDAQFHNNPRTTQLLPSGDENGMFFRSAIMTLNQEENFTFVKELRSLLDQYNPSRFLIGEVFGDIDKMVKYCGGSRYDGLHSVFLFDSMATKFTKEGFYNLIKKFESKFEDPLIPTWTFSNHDRYRSIHRLGNSMKKAKLLAGLQLTLRGIPYIYYGEEIGMQQSEFPFNTSKDALAIKYSKFPKILQKIAMKLTDGAINRDGCRTPMQWNIKKHAGFSTATDTWLPVHQSHTVVNVENELRESSSLLQVYKHFLTVRNEFPQLHAGDLELIDNKHKFILEYRRTFKGEVFIILANFSNKKQSYRINSAERILSNIDVEGAPMELNNEIKIEPFELILLRNTHS